MATWDDVRRLALALPEVTESTSYGQPAWKVRDRLVVWERPLARGDRAALGDAAPDGPVLGVRVPDAGAAQAVVASSPACFTIPHFDGYPAVLVRLDEIELPELEELVVEAWLSRAPARLAAAWLAERG